MNIKKWLRGNIWIWSVLGSIVIWIVISIITGNFSLKLLRANAILASFLVLISLGQMIVITSGNGAIDLSLQYTIALAAYVSSTLMNSYGFIIGLIITLFICATIGVINGIINMYLKVPAMITTLAVGYIVYSAVLVVSSKTTGVPLDKIANFTQKYSLLGISPLVYIAIIVAFCIEIILYKTKFGKELHAVGQNRIAASLAGVSVVKIVITAFVISSLLAGISGVLLGGYFGGASQDMGLSYLMTSIAACVIGGTSAAGGKSSVAGTVCGAMLLTLIVACLNISRLPMSYQNLIQGCLLMIILIASVPKKTNK